MTSIARVYTDELKDHFKIYYGTWDPNTPLRLGDVGTTDGNIFIRRGSLANYDLEFEEREDFDDAHFDFQSSEGVEVEFAAKGKVPNVNARVEIRFSRKNAVFFNAAACKSRSIEDQLGLGRKILDRYEARQWDADNYVVTSIVDAGATTVLVSSADEAKVTLEAQSDEIANIDLTDASISLRLAGYHNVGLKVVAATGLSPLIGLSRVKAKLFKRPRFGPAFLTPTALQAIGAAETRVGVGEQELVPAGEELYFGDA